jgi:Ca2+-transporting ATPase
LNPAFAELLQFGILASAPEPFDPMEKAFHELGARSGTKTAATGALVRAYGLRPELLAVTHVWRDREIFVIASKGAPEAIARLCRSTAGELSEIKAAVDSMATEGLRILGVARARFGGETLPSDPRGFDFEFLGLVGLTDPLRESVPAAVAECRSAGIRVVMITGDYPATARAIARQAGLESRQLMTGEELEKCADVDLSARVRAVNVFARIMPEQKLRIVNSLKSCGEIVAMTGDGVNDAPSLKAAHIGIAMGGRGTDVAREASSIVLLNDDFGSVVKAVRLGRRIYDNLRKAMEFIFAVHVPIAGLALLPLAFGLPIIFSPIHIAFLEMVIDPVCTLVFESETEEADIMQRPPRVPDEPLFSASLIGWSVLQGLLAFVLVAAIYVIADRRGMPETQTRALAFFSLVTAIVALIFVNRSFSASLVAAFARPNRALKYVLSGVVGILALTLAWPVASNLFRFGPLHADDLAVTLGAGVLVLLILDFFKPRLGRGQSARLAQAGRRLPRPK